MPNNNSTTVPHTSWILWNTSVDDAMGSDQLYQGLEFDTKTAQVC